MRTMMAAAALLLLAGCSGKTETETGERHDGAMTAMQPAAADTAATQAYKEVMAAMMHDAPAYTGDADVDFLRQMRVHHIAAVAMAQAELAHGKDRQARRLAQEVIAAQRREIAVINRWLAAKGG